MRVFWMIVAGMVVSAPALAGIPLAEVKNNDHDFGDIWINQREFHTFKIANAGDGQLEILDVRGTCPCVTVARFDRRIAPGKTGDVAITLDTSSSVYGRFRKKVTVTTNDPAHRKIDLKFKGVVHEYIRREPVGVGFKRIGRDESASKRVSLTNQTDGPVKLELVGGARQGAFNVDLSEIVSDQKWSLVVTASPPYQPYQNRASIKIKTGLPEQPFVTVNCTAYVPPRLELRPYRLVANPRLALRKIEFTNNGPTPVKVLSVKSDDPRVLADWVEVEAGRRYTLRVVMPIGFIPPEKGIMILVATDDADQPVLKVPFTRTLVETSGK